MSLVVIYQTPGALEVRRAVQHALERLHTTVLARGAFESLLGPHVCGVACFASVSNERVAWLSRLTGLHPEHPVIVVAPLTSDGARLLVEGANRPLRVVWLDEVPRRLSDVVASVLTSDPVRDIIMTVARKVSDSPLVSSALSRIATEEPPYRRVSDLAAALKVPVSTLRAHWNAQAGGGPSIKETLEWVLLLRSLQRAGRGAGSMAQRVRIHVRTLERLAHRRLSVSVATLRHQHPGGHVGAFRNRLMRLTG